MKSSVSEWNPSKAITKPSQSRFQASQSRKSWHGELSEKIDSCTELSMYLTGAKTNVMVLNRCQRQVQRRLLEKRD